MVEGSPAALVRRAEYVGASFIETYLHDADALHPEAAEAVGDGAMFALAPGQGIFAHREAGAVLHAYVALNRPAEWFASIDFADAVVATGRIATEFEGWARALTALITREKPRPLCACSTLSRLATDGSARQG